SGPSAISDSALKPDREDRRSCNAARADPVAADSVRTERHLRFRTETGPRGLQILQRRSRGPSRGGLGPDRTEPSMRPELLSRPASGSGAPCQEPPSQPVPAGMYYEGVIGPSARWFAAAAFAACVLI